MDDEQLVRSGILGLLELREDLTVVGEAAGGREAIAMVRVAAGGDVTRRADAGGGRVGGAEPFAGGGDFAAYGGVDHVRRG